MNERLEPRIRILLGSSIAIVPGKAALLEAIGETGSIAAAGRAWGELPPRLDCSPRR
jgi:molybdate transport system regulatory protein